MMAEADSNVSAATGRQGGLTGGKNSVSKKKPTKKKTSPRRKPRDKAPLVLEEPADEGQVLQLRELSEKAEEVPCCVLS